MCEYLCVWVFVCLCVCVCVFVYVCLSATMLKLYLIGKKIVGLKNIRPNFKSVVILVTRQCNNNWKQRIWKFKSAKNLVRGQKFSHIQSTSFLPIRYVLQSYSRSNVPQIFTYVLKRFSYASLSMIHTYFLPIAYM